MNRKNNFKAFTLAEIFIVLMVIGLISVITISSVLGSAKSKIRKIQVASKTFYSNVETIYNDVLHNYTSGYNFANVEGITGDTLEDNKLVAKIFSKYLDGELLDDCSELVIETGQTVSEYKNGNLACARFNTGIVAGFSYNKNCEYLSSSSSSSGSSSGDEEESDLSQLDVIEYLKTIEEDEAGELSARTTPNTCGYIIYGFPGTKGTFGKDLFTIALGRRGVK